MNKIDIRNHIHERYYTIGRSYFKEKCPEFEFPSLEIFDMRTKKDNGDIDRETVAEQVSLARAIDMDDKIMKGFRPSHISFFILNIIDQLVNIDLSIPTIVWKIYIDHIILHEISHAIIAFGFSKKRKYYNCKFEDISDFINKEREGEEYVVEKMAHERLLEIYKSKLHIAIEEYLYKIKQIELKIHDIRKVENYNKGSINNLFNQKDNVVDELNDLVKDLNSPYRLSVLLSLSDKFDKRRDDLIYTRSGVYLSKTTNMIVLEPKPY